MNPSLFRALLQRATASSEPDAELLGRFTTTRDESAFAELVRRYAGLVWGQCRHLLPNEADAEDAFQATFLALARRPGAVRTAVGPYLHGVAYRVCLNARRLAGRRKRHEVAAATSEAAHPVADSAWDAALAAVHGEVHRLPEPQRVAFILCVLEGRGLSDAAAELGVKLGTLSARLSRAKRTVMDRLAARGVLAGMAALAALGGRAGVSAAVVDKAVQSAVGAAVVPTAVQSLAHGVTNMAAFKLKALAAGVLLACGLGLGVGPGWVANGQEKPKAKIPPTPEQDAADLRMAEAKYHTLRLELLQAQADLDKARLKAQTGAAKPVGPAPLQPEFRYVPLRDNAGTVEAFEKLVKDGEVGGYSFVGAVPLKGFKETIGQTTVTTLVFRKKPEAAIPLATEAGSKPEKLYTVNFDNVPWPKVTEWLAKETGLTLVGDVAPQGTFTNKLDRKVPIGELMDLFNEVLAQQKLILIRGEQTLRYWPADKQMTQLFGPRVMTQLFGPRVRVEDLPKFGKSEIVSVVIPLNGSTAEDAEKLAKRLKSPLGEVVTVLGKNQLVVIDRAGEVRTVIAALDKQLKKNPLAADAGKQPNPFRIALKNGNEVGAAVRAAAVIKYADRPNALKVEVNWAVVKLSGDDDAVKWGANLIDELTK